MSDEWYNVYTKKVKQKWSNEMLTKGSLENWDVIKKWDAYKRLFREIRQRNKKQKLQKQTKDMRYDKGFSAQAPKQIVIWEVCGNAKAKKDVKNERATP